MTRAIVALALIVFALVGAYWALGSDAYQHHAAVRFAGQCFSNIECRRFPLPGDDLSPEIITNCSSFVVRQFDGRGWRGYAAEIECETPTGRRAILVMQGSPFHTAIGGWAVCERQDCADAWRALRWTMTSQR
jgi:hypothetical protein